MMIRAKLKTTNGEKQHIIFRRKKNKKLLFLTVWYFSHGYVRPIITKTTNRSCFVPGKNSIEKP
jgi:hypothetical protein